MHQIKLNKGSLWWPLKYVRSVQQKSICLKLSWNGSHGMYGFHHNSSCDRSIRKCVIALAEEGGLRASTADELYGVLKSTARAWLQKYRRDGKVGRCRGNGLWHVSSPAPDAVLVAEAQRNPFISARDLKAATGKNPCLFWDLRKQVSGHNMLWWKSLSLTNLNYTV